MSDGLSIRDSLMTGCSENGQNREVVTHVDLPTGSELDTRNLESTLEPVNGKLSSTKRKAPLYHKGVHLKQSNNKFVARLCLPGEKKKLELGEYHCHEEAARAYEVGAFYYQRSGCRPSFHDKIPPIPDNISGEKKRTWVRARARHCAQLFAHDVPERLISENLGSGCSSLSCGNLTDADPTPASSDAAPTPVTSDAPTPVTSDAENFVSSQDGHDNEFWDYYLDVTSVDRRKLRKADFAHDPTLWIPTSSRHRDIIGLSKRQAAYTVPELKMTDSILFAQCELHKQGWVWTLKPSRPSTSSKTGKVLFSLPEGQSATPALLITDIIISSFYELREQGWEVHLEASKRDVIQCEARPLPRMKISPNSFTAGSNSLSPTPECSFRLPELDAAAVNMINDGNTTTIFGGDSSEWWSMYD